MFFSERITALAREAETALAEHFNRIDEISYHNTNKVMDAFREHKVAATNFDTTSGYGYDDRGRDVLDRIWADVMGCEAAFVRHNIVNGTQALTIGLFGLLRPGDLMCSVAGKPYDTLEEVIGIAGEAGNGSLADFGVRYKQIELTESGDFDLDAIKQTLDEEIKSGKPVKVIFIQRSKGYLNRKTLSVSEINALYSFVKQISPDTYVVVDNCYGEFTEMEEPHVDMLIGSLIKNPGGGMAETGGYIAGSARAVELASYRLTSVGCGLEVGATVGQTKNMYKGLFYAPHCFRRCVSARQNQAKRWRRWDSPQIRYVCSPSRRRASTW